MEESKNTVEIPEGKELKSVRVVCEKHGDVTNACAFFSYETKNAAGKLVKENAAYCIPCINEYLHKLQAAGEIGKLSLVPIVADKEHPDGNENIPVDKIQDALKNMK